MTQVAIIGAGAAGLAVGQALVQRMSTPKIYEKSLSVGGRNMTRYIEGCVIDHGAQCIKTPSPALLHLVDTSAISTRLPAYDIRLPIWVFNASGVISEGDAELNAEPKWGWHAGVNMLTKTLASGLDVRMGVNVRKVMETGNRYPYTLLNAEGAILAEAEAVVLTPPGPQTAEMIAVSVIDQMLKDRLLAELSQVTYRRCLSVALAYARRPAVPWYALLNTDRQHPIAWLACEHVKPGHAPEGMGLLLAQMGHTFSLEHWDTIDKGIYGKQEPLPPVLAEIHHQVQALLADDLGPPLWADVHCWRYALPDTTASFEQLNSTGSGLFFAGDYVANQGRVHLAIESGWRVAELITATYQGGPPGRATA